MSWQTRHNLHQALIAGAFCEIREEWSVRVESVGRSKIHLVVHEKVQGRDVGDDEGERVSKKMERFLSMGPREQRNVGVTS